MARPEVFLYTVFAGIEIVAGIAAFLLGNIIVANPSTNLPPVLFFFFVVLFSSTGAFLLMDSSRDRRAAYLGCVFLSIACSFAHPVLVTFGSRQWALSAYISPLAAMQAEAFLPCFLWLFARDFPQAAVRGQRRAYVSYAVWASCVAAFLLAAGNTILVLDLLGPQFSSVYQILGSFARDIGNSYYWLVIFLLAVPALPLSVWRARAAAPEERRRVFIFVMGIVTGLAPVILVAVGGAISPAFYDFTIRRHIYITGLVAYTALVAFPFITMYSVVVNQVLDVRLIVRKALQYAFARSTVTALFLSPMVALAVYVYANRGSTISALFSEPVLIVLLGITLAGVALSQLRQRTLGAIDRVFFRDQCDAREILSVLAERSRLAGNARELTTLMVEQLDRAFHLESVAVLLLEGSQSHLRHPAGQMRPLSRASNLMQYIERSSEAVTVDLENPRSPLNRLPLEDREWLGDSGARLLVPLIASDAAVVGVILLGAKKNELPYSREDQLLLQSIAAAAALTIENRSMREPLSAARAAASGREDLEDQYAVECPSCDDLHASAETCPKCGGNTVAAAVPPVLLGKFRVERKVGRGGMGVVYRAVDLTLGRTVAIKTLPKVAPEYSVRLRREARTMASLSHPNLALIFGAETWRGIPMLVFEFLEGGTLEDRLKSGMLDIREAIQLGVVLASVLERTHEAGILHCDIKPSNIGFTRQRVPKLLDFGLAHILNDFRISRALPYGPSISSDETRELISTAAIHEATLFGPLAGTPCYLCPEALKGKPPSVSFDLWGLALVLYEAVTGLNVFKADSLIETLNKVKTCAVPDLRELRPDCSRDVAAFFADELSRDSRRRSATAVEFRLKLEDLSVRPVAAHNG